MKFRNYLIPSLTLLAIVLFVWLFSKVVLYLFIALVLSFMGQPLVKLYSKLRYKNVELPDAVVAALTLVTMAAGLFFMFWLFIPVLTDEIQFLSTLNFNDIFAEIIDQFPQIKQLLLHFGSEKDIADSIVKELNKYANLDNISTVVNSLISITGKVVAGTLAVLFITFFILKDFKLVNKSILLITPVGYENEVQDILKTTRFLLTKYFVGLFIDGLIVFVLVTSLMFFLGINNALIIGFFTGIMNIIPYVGPLISLGFALFLGLTGCIEYGQMHEIGNVFTKIFFVLLGVNILDGIFIQPYIFSNSVKAHPLEIFLVILMAATVAGIAGMVVAIPTYTLLRIIAKEFLVNFKFFKKITENIPGQINQHETKP